MSNELVPFKVNLPSVAQNVDTLDDVAKGTDFLQRIQLITKGKYVDQGKITPGHWGIPKGDDDIEDLGDKIDVVIFAYRPKALDVSDRDAIVAVYDVESEEFARIKAAPKNTGCMWGPSFLVLERSTGKLYELFFGNKSGRQEAGKMKPFLLSQEPMSLGTKYIKKPDYGWHVPVVTKCSEPFDADNVKVTPEQIQQEVDKFLNPQEETVEKVSEEETQAQGRAR